MLLLLVSLYVDDAAIFCCVLCFKQKTAYELRISDWISDVCSSYLPVRGDVRFKNVAFHYGKGSGVIEHLDLHVRPGEKIGMVGRSGAGKSTLANLLLRFHDVEAGRITVDGIDIAGVQQDSLRAQVGVVTQDTSLLHRSVRDNLLYGRPDASEEEMREAARQANADGFI